SRLGQARLGCTLELAHARLQFGDPGLLHGQFLGHCRTGQATFFSAVPTIYAMLVSRPGARPDTRSLRFVICGATPMPRQLIGEFEERFGVPGQAGEVVVRGPNVMRGYLGRPEESAQVLR